MSYDTITKCHTFVNTTDFVEGVNALSDKKIKEGSCYLSLRGLRFEDVDKNFYHYRSTSAILHGLKEDFNIPVDLTKSTKIGRVFKIYLTEDISLQDDTKELPVKESPVVEQTTVIEDKEATLTEDDLWKVYNEDDKKGSKDALETLVKEATGIDLNKRASFEKMVKEYLDKVK